MNNSAPPGTLACPATPRSPGLAPRWRLSHICNIYIYIYINDYTYNYKYTYEYIHTCISQ